MKLYQRWFVGMGISNSAIVRHSARVAKVRRTGEAGPAWVAAVSQIPSRCSSELELIFRTEPRLRWKVDFVRSFGTIEVMTGRRRKSGVDNGVSHKRCNDHCSIFLSLELNHSEHFRPPAGLRHLQTNSLNQCLPTFSLRNMKNTKL